MIKIKKGLDIPISGSPEDSISDFKKPRSVGLIGSDYNGLKPAMLVKEGDKVLFAKYAGTEVKVEGEELLIMREDDVLAVLS